MVAIRFDQCLLLLFHLKAIVLLIANCVPELFFSFNFLNSFDKNFHLGEGAWAGIMAAMRSWVLFTQPFKAVGYFLPVWESGVPPLLFQGALSEKMMRFVWLFRQGLARLWPRLPRHLRRISIMRGGGGALSEEKGRFADRFLQ